MKPESKKDTSKTILNTLLVIIGAILLLTGIFVFLIYIMAPHMPVGWGDGVLFALFPISLCWLLGVIYVVIAISYAIKRIKSKLPINKLHSIIALAILIIILAPFIAH